MTPTNIPLVEMTLRQLRRVASVLGVSRYSRMRKDQLLSSILEKQGLVDSQVLNETLLAAVKPEPGLEMDAALADVDVSLPDLPAGYGESRIFLLPRDPQWAYVYWDIPNQHRQELRSQGGEQLALRLYDVTGRTHVGDQVPHSLQEYPCDEMAREWYMPVPVSDRDYMLEIGYRTGDGRWLVLARSATMRTPPVYPADWVEDHFVTVPWENDLRGQTVLNLTPPNEVVTLPGSLAGAMAYGGAAAAMFDLAAGAHVPGSRYEGPGDIDSLSSYVFPSGVGMWAVPNASGLNASGLNAMGALGLNAFALNTSGLNMSGLNMSGVGMVPSIRPRNFWLIADAELIVYGATEPDATVYVDGERVPLSSDGTFRFQMSFQDGQLKFPIVAIAADGEQQRSVRMDFERQTSDRVTNTKAEAVTEWFPA
jgi:uncharacterized protein